MTGQVWRGMVVLMAGIGCALLPVRREHVVSMAFQPGTAGTYFTDPADRAGVFRTDGLVVKVQYLSRQKLEAEYAQYKSGRVSLNPFTYGTRIDNDKGYVPDRFTVFEVEVNNIGLAKVLLDPRKVVLVTDRGARLHTWAVEKGEAADTFEEYYRARRGAGGNDQDWYRQRIAIAERSLYNGERPVFKGERNRGKLVFAVLPEQVRTVRLEMPEFVMGFDADGLPAQVEDLVFEFEVVTRVERDVQE